MKVSAPLVTVIIPCYNVEAFINECIVSVYSQTYRPIEVICIDNNSTDSTYQTLLNLKKTYPDLILEKEKCPGAPAARNKGLGIAKGHIIQFLDADDIIDPVKFERQVVGFKDPQVDIIVSDRIIKNEGLTSEIDRLTFEEIEADPLNTALSQIIITGNPLYRKSALQKIGGFDEHLNSAQDWDLNLRLVFKGAKIKYVPGFYFITRKLSTSLSSDWIKVSIQAAELLLAYKPILSKHRLNETSLSKICFTFYESILHTDDEAKKELYLQDLLFWAIKSRFNFLSKPKCIIAKTLGLRSLIWMDTFLLKIQNRLLS